MYNLPPKSLFARRGYFHFDEPVSPASARKLATDAARVAAWAFLPMLHCMLSVKKVKRQANGSLESKIKNRPIEYAAHKDAAIYSAYGYVLSQEYERELAIRKLGKAVTAFRRASGRCNIHFAKEAFDWIAKKGPCVSLAFDIESFFSTLDHGILKTQWSQLFGGGKLADDHYAVFRSITRYSWVDRKAVFKEFGISDSNPRADGRLCICSPADFRNRVRNKGLIQTNRQNFGIPQGSPMSAILSNIYMLDFDSDVMERVASVGGLYRRYCDDMLCVVPTEAASDIESYLMERIKDYKLTIQEAKTKRHHFELSGGKLVSDSPLQYLGFLFDGSRTVLRTASISRYYKKMRSGVTLAALTMQRHNKLRAIHDEPLEHKLYRRKLHIRYSYLGRHNFIAYALRAANQMNEPAIKRQLRAHWRKLNRQIRKEESKH
jgi:RNA-directed DNA polymerase